MFVWLSLLLDLRAVLLISYSCHVKGIAGAEQLAPWHEQLDTNHPGCSCLQGEVSCLTDANDPSVARTSWYLTLRSSMGHLHLRRMEAEEHNYTVDISGSRLSTLGSFLEALFSSWRSYRPLMTAHLHERQRKSN